MTAQVFQLPIAARPNFMSPAWLDQRNREVKAQLATTVIAPALTRPCLVNDADQPAAAEYGVTRAGTFADLGLPEVNLDTIVQRTSVKEPA
jgi:hypothetical protein